MSDPIFDGTGRLVGPFFDGKEYAFRLPVRELRALQAARKKGCYAIFRSLSDGTWYVEDVEEIIRLGLRGGGMDANDIADVMKHHVAEKPIMENLPVAKLILMAALFGPPEEDRDKLPGKDQAESTTDESTSPV